VGEADVAGWTSHENEESWYWVTEQFTPSTLAVMLPLVNP